jgi:microcystin-dependent protein
VIVMWSGSVATIPTGWFLCDGGNGTPDLRDRFIVGAGSSYAVAATGGSKDAIVVSHSHTGSTNTTGEHTHTYNNDPTATSAVHPTGSGSQNSRGNNEAVFTTSSSGAHAHSFTTNSTGSSGTNANLPPYYALAYIMKA